MRIFDDEGDKKLDMVSLFLTREEALQLESYLKQFLNKEIDKGLHFHLSSENYLCTGQKINLYNASLQPYIWRIRHVNI